jgi:hypothetical protein
MSSVISVDSSLSLKDHGTKTGHDLKALESVRDLAAKLIKSDYTISLAQLKEEVQQISGSKLWTSLVKEIERQLPKFLGLKEIDGFSHYRYYFLFQPSFAHVVGDRRRYFYSLTVIRFADRTRYPSKRRRFTRLCHYHGCHHFLRGNTIIIHRYFGRIHSQNLHRG